MIIDLNQNQRVFLLRSYQRKINKARKQVTPVKKKELIAAARRDKQLYLASLALNKVDMSVSN